MGTALIETSIRRQQVLSLMGDGIARTRYQIAEALKWRDGPVCGRVRELIDMGKLKVVGYLHSTDTHSDRELVRISRKRRAA